jgi:hypothetical protein
MRIYACAVNGRTRDAATGLAVSLALVLGSCGDEGGTGASTATEPGRLTAAESETIVVARESVGRYCTRIAQRRGALPSAGEFDGVAAALDELAALARRRPNDVDPSGASAELALGDIAENLEGSNCDSRLVERIDEQLAALPGS